MWVELRVAILYTVYGTIPSFAVASSAMYTEMAMEGLGMRLAHAYMYRGMFMHKVIGGRDPS